MNSFKAGAKPNFRQSPPMPKNTTIYGMTAQDIRAQFVDLHRDLLSEKNKNERLRETLTNVLEQLICVVGVNRHHNNDITNMSIQIRQALDGEWDEGEES